MAEEEALPTAFSRCGERQPTKVPPLVSGQRLQRELPGGFGHRAKRRGASWIHVIPHRMIVIPADDERCAFANGANDSFGLGTVVDEIAEDPGSAGMMTPAKGPDPALRHRSVIVRRAAAQALEQMNRRKESA